MLGYGMVVPLLPFFIAEQAGQAIIVGSIGALYALMQFFSVPVLGAISDRVGRRPVLLLCLAGTGSAYLLLGAAQALPFVVLAVMLDGITGGTPALSQAYITDRTSDAERARGLGIIGAAFGLGLLLGPAFGGVLSSYGLHVPAFVAAAMAFSNVLFGWLTLSESLPAAQRRRFAPSLRELNPATHLLALVRMQQLRVLLLVVLLVNLTFSGLPTNFPLFSAARFGWDPLANGVFFAFVGITAALTQGVLLGWVQPLLGERRLLLVGLGLMVINFALMASVSQGWMLYPVVGALAVGSGFVIPSVTSLITQRTPADARGRVLGGTNAIISLAMMIGPLMAGVVFDGIAVTAPYWLGSGLSVVAVAVVAVAFVPTATATSQHPRSSS